MEHGDVLGPSTYKGKIKENRAKVKAKASGPSGLETTTKKQSCGRIGATKKLVKNAKPQACTSSENPMSFNSDGGLDDASESRTRTSTEDLETDWEDPDRAQIMEMQLADTTIKRLHEWKEKGDKPEWCGVAHLELEVKYYWHRRQL